MDHRTSDDVIERVYDEVQRVRRDLDSHMSEERDTSPAAFVRRNAGLVAVFMVQAVALSWWLSGLVAGMERGQEILQLKLTTIEQRLSDSYGAGMAARDFALRDQAIAENKRRIDAHEARHTP